MHAPSYIVRSLLVPSLVALSMLPPRAQAQEQSTAEPVKAAQNPIANMMSFPFQNNINFDLGGCGWNQNVLNIQPVLPFYNGLFITRTIIPLTWQPDMLSADGTSFGVGDILFTAFYAPPSEGSTWGIGPVVSIPKGRADFGTKKWGLGPSANALAMPGGGFSEHSSTMSGLSAVTKQRVAHQCECQLLQQCGEPGQCGDLDTARPGRGAASDKHSLGSVV